MNKIEQNDFLFNIMTNPDYIASPEKPFEFHPLDLKTDPTIEFIGDVQYIAVEGPYNGKIYLSKQYLLFKSHCQPIFKPLTRENPEPTEYKFALKVNNIIFYFLIFCIA